MTSGDQVIEADGAQISVGTALYDTECDRVLWVIRIDVTGVTVEPTTPYEVANPIGWTAGPEDRLVTEGTVFSRGALTALITNGRFEVSP